MPASSVKTVQRSFAQLRWSLRRNSTFVYVTSFALPWSGSDINLHTKVYLTNYVNKSTEGWTDCEAKGY
ncbi:MAG: hypothetical protein ACTS46_01220 [Candidatus Hodgkinia cicadicola]